jgi:hypothetical protein
LFSPREIFEQQYKEAAAEGAIVELRLRILANKVPELRKFAHEQNLKDVETPITQHFAASLTEEDKSTLMNCRQLRNKILHCDFRAARKKLNDLGVKTQRGNIKKADASGLSAAQLVEQMERVFADDESAFEYVSDSAVGADDIFAWLLEVGNAGDFIEATRAFEQAAAIVDRLAAT